MKKLILLMLSMAVLPETISGQKTGLPPFGSLTKGGFDTVNNQNLNVLFGIPIFSSAGRGLPLNLNLVYNSLIWKISSNSWTPVNDSSGNPTWGWEKDFPVGGSISYTTSTTYPKCEPGGYFYPVTWYQNYKYKDAFGSTHDFTGVYDEESACPTYNGHQYTGHATDASGYYINILTGDFTKPIIRAPNGEQVVNSVSTAVDVNGNYVTRTTVSCSGCVETDWTDSVGNVALKVIYTPSTTSPTSIQYKFLDGTGPSNYQTIALQFQSASIKTNFGCTVGEYTGTANLPSELDIPSPVSGTIKYTFSYEPTPNNTGYTTGRLQKIILPTGGSYQWDYTGNNDGINCLDGTTLGLNRTVSDGTNTATWNYVRNTTNLTTTVTTPQLADTSNAFATVYSFSSSGQEIVRQVYSTTTTTGTPLRATYTTWAANGTPSSQNTFLEDGSTQSEIATTYDSNGLIGTLKEYDWKLGGLGNLLRVTTYTYQTASTYTGQNLINLVTSKVIADGSGTVQYRQNTTYDGTALTCPTGVAQHDDTDYACTSNYRGNATAVTTYTLPATSSGPITRNFTYDWFGNLLTAQLSCCNTKSWTYSSTYQYAQPTMVQSGSSPAQLTTTYTYNAYTGLIASSIDSNGLETDYAFDFLRRPTSVSRKNGSTAGQSVSTAYDDIGFTTATTTTIDSSNSIKQIAAADPFGRTLTTTTKNANGTIFSIIKNEYDFTGAAYGVSNPYTTGNPAYWTTTTVDLAHNKTTVKLPDNSTTTYVSTTNTVVMTDAAGKQRKSTYDGAGRVIITTEPDLTNGNSLTLNTTYTYTVLNALASVTTTDQHRIFNYDGLGQLLSTVTPEGGTTCFGSLSGSTCNTDGYDSFDNLLVKRTDARGVLTSYGYDGLNRLTSVGYSSVSGVSNTSPVSLIYGLDSSCVSAHGAGCIGQVITMTDGVGSENYTYNSLEQLTKLQKVVNGVTYITSYLYNLAGELTQITYPSGRMITQNLDTVGRRSSIVGMLNSVQTTYASGYGYNPAGKLTGFQYGNGIFASLGFSADRLLLNCLDYSTTNRNGICSHDGTTKFGLDYSYGTAGNNEVVPPLVET